MSRPRIHDWDAVLALWADGGTQWTISHATGIAFGAVGTIVHLARLRGDPRAVRRRPPREERVPGWVIAAGLTDDYRDVARERGEEEAAAHCRALKREMAA